MKGHIKALLLAAFLIAGGGFFLLGRSTAMSEYAKERDLDIRVNRSELEGLGTIEGPIYVTGHKSPDADTVGCSIGYAALLQKLGYDARPVVLGPVNNETKYILEAAGAEAPEILEDASGCNMVLVDHSEYSQSAAGLEDANILSIIDHHGLGSVKTGTPLVFDARPVGSAATIVWMRYRNYGVELDKKTAMVMMGSILSDTQNLKLGNTTTADREALNALRTIAGVSDSDAFFQDMFKASLSYQ